MNYDLNPQQVSGLTNTVNPYIPITLNDEQESIDNQIKSNINTYVTSELGPLDLGPVNFKVNQGEVENITDLQRWNRGVVEKSQSWIGGITGRQPLHIDMAYYGLFGKTKDGWGSYIPFNPYPWEEIEKARERVDDNFVVNKNKEISNVITSRYGEQQAPLIEKLLEQNYGYDWKKTFAVGTKNPEAFLEQVQRALLNESVKTSYFSERKSELQGISESLPSAVSRFTQLNILKDYDTLRDIALTGGLEVWMSGGLPAINTAAKVASKWSLRIPKTILGNSQFGTRLFNKLEPMFVRQEAILGRSNSVWKAMLTDFALERRPLVRNIARLESAKKLGGITTETNRQFYRRAFESNPFSPISQPRKWMQWNNLNIINSSGVTLKEGFLKTATQKLLNNVGLGVDDIINLTDASTLGQWMWKFARTGAVLGSAEGLANSIFTQQDMADQAMLMENRDIPAFDIGQTLSDTAVMGGVGFVFGGGLGLVFSPVLAAKSTLRLIDGTETLGTSTPQRGILQLIGSGRVTQEEWEKASNLRRLLGVRGHQALQLAKTSKLEQVRAILKHVTGDDRTFNFYLDPNWMEANDISEHEIGSVIDTVLEILSRSSSEYSVNPLSHEMLSEVFTGFAKAKAAAKEAGTPLPTALDADIIGGLELREKMTKYGLLDVDPNEPVQNTKTILNDSELTKAEVDLNNKIKNGELTVEEAEEQKKILNRAKRKNEFIKARLSELEQLRAKKALAEEQYPDPATRSEEINNLINSYDLAIERNERYIKNLSKEKTNHVRVETNSEGSIDRIVISGYDISNTQAGFILTRYLSALKRFNEAGGITDVNTRRLAREKLRAEIDAIETEMDSRYQLNQENKTRSELRTNWANEKWNQLKNDPIKLAKFEEAFGQALSSRRLTSGERAVAMNWYSQIRNGTGFGRIYNKLATWGSGTTDSMYQLSDLAYEAFRMVDDGQFFAYSDLANPYQVFSIREAIENGIRKAVGVNDVVARIKKKYQAQAKTIQQRVITAQRAGKNTIDGAGLTPEMIEEANLLLNKTRDFYEYSANKSKELGKQYDDAFTYFPQMLTRKLNNQEVERLAALGYEAMNRKLKDGKVLSYAELERLGLIERDEDGTIVNIPETSLFYLTDPEGNPLPMDQMISKMPKTLEELRAFETRRRLETDKTASLPPDLQAVLNSPIKMSTITEAEKKKTTDTLKSIINKLLERSQAVLGGEYDLVRAGQHIVNLKQRATEFGDNETLKWVSDTIKELKEKRGIEVNENPENPTTTILNSRDNVKLEDKPTLKTIFIGAPEVSVTKEGKKTLVYPGSVFKKWVPETEVTTSKTLPSLSFTTKMSDEALAASPFSKEAQEIGHHYTQAVVAKQLASKFGEEEPTTYLQTIKLEDMQDSLITMEHILSWTDDPEFISQVDAHYKLFNGKFSKTDIGMYLLGGYVSRAKEYNLSQIKLLTEPQLAKLRQEFHNINYLTLRSRYEGTPIKALNPIELLNKIYNETGTSIQRGKPLWTPSIETKPIQRIEVPTLTETEKENAAAFNAWWKERKQKSSEKRRLEKRRDNLLDAIKQHDEILTDLKQKGLTEDQKKWYKEIKKQREETIARLLTTKDKPVKFNAETKKAAKRKLNSITKQLNEVYGDEPVYNGRTRSGTLIPANEETGIRITRTEKVLDKLSEQELFNLFTYYNHIAPHITGQSNLDKVDPILKFLFASIDDKVEIASKIGKLEELGINSSHILQNGALSSEGKVAYLKKLANSQEVLDVVNRFTRAIDQPEASKQLSRQEASELAKEYWRERSTLLDNLKNTQETYHLYVEDLEALQLRREDLLETQEMFDQLVKGLIDFEDVALKIETNNKKFNDRFVFLTRKVDEVNEVISKLKEENKWQKNYDEFNDVVDRKTNQIKELESYVIKLETERNNIQLQLKPLREKELEGYNIKEVNSLRSNIETEIKQIEEQITKTIQEDPIKRAERELDSLDSSSKYDGITKVNKEQERLNLMTEVSKKLELKRQELSDLKTMNLGQHNETITNLITEIDKINTTINKLQKAGTTPNRRFYVNRLQYLATQIEETEKAITELYRNPEFSLVDPTLTNFSSMYEWMKNVVNTFEERTQTAQDTLQRLVNKPDEPAFINFNISRKSLDAFKTDKEIIMDGMELGLLFYRIVSPERETRVGPKERLLVVDLSRDRFEPVDLTGDIQQARTMIEHRRAHNLENPNDQITLDKILEKREQLAFENPELLKLSKQINRMIKSTKKWVDQRNTYVNYVVNPELITSEFTDLVISDQLKKVLDAFNIIPAQSELAKKKFNEVFDTLKSFSDKAKQVRLDELNKQKLKQVGVFTKWVEASQKEQVPVFSKERQDIVKQLLEDKQQLVERLREYGDKISIPSTTQQKEGYKLGDLEIEKLHGEISDLLFALFDLAEGKMVSRSIVSGANFNQILKNKVRKLAKKRKLTLQQAAETLKLETKDLQGKFFTPKDLELLDRIPGIKPFIRKKGTDNIQINHRFTTSMMFKILESADQQTAEAMRKLIIVSSRRVALNRISKVGGLSKKISEEAVSEAFNITNLLMLSYNNAMHNPEILGSLKTVQEKIQQLNTELETANYIRASEIEEDLKKYRSIEASIKMPDTFREQSYGIVNKDGDVVDRVLGEKVYFRGLAGENYPDTNLNLRSFVNRVANTTIEQARGGRGLVSRAVSLDDISDVMDLETGDLNRFIDPTEVRGRASNSDYLRPDDQLSKQETLQSVMRFLRERDSFIKESPSVIQRALNGNEISQTVYRPFVDTVIELIESDLKKISNGAKPLFLTVGEKDRITQRTNIGIIKNQNAFFEAVASTLRSKYNHLRVGRTNKFNFSIIDGVYETITINNSFVEKAFKQFKKELRIVKEESLADVARLELQLGKAKRYSEGVLAKSQTDPKYRIRYYETWAELTQYLKPEQLVDLVLKLKEVEPEKGLNITNWKTVPSINTKERVGGKTQISLADLKNRILSGKITQSQLWEDFRISLSKAQNAEEAFYVTSEGLRYPTPIKDFVSKEGTTSVQNYADQISLELYGEFFLDNITKVADSISDPELALKWALTEMAELKQKLSQPRLGTVTEKNNALNIGLTIRELSIFTDFVEEFARKNYVGLDSKFGKLYEQALTDAGFSGKVRQASDVDNIMADAIESVNKESPLSEIVTKFGQIDMWKEFEVLSYIVSKGSPKELLATLPESSLLNIIDELEQFGLITVLPETKEVLIKELLNNKPLNNLLSITNNGLEVLQKTNHASNRRGYFGGKNIKLEAEILQNPFKQAEEQWASKQGMIANPALFTDMLSTAQKNKAYNGIQEFMVLSFRKELVEKQLKILNKASADGLGLYQLLQSETYESKEKGILLLKELQNKEDDLVKELNEVKTRLSDLVGVSTELERPAIKKLPQAKVMREAVEKPKPLSSKPWIGSSDSTSVADKYLDALNGNTRHYVGRWSTSGNTGLQDDMRAWAYGLNNQPYTKPTTYTRTTLEKQRPVPYQGLGKPSFTTEDLLMPENSELASILSDDIGDVTMRYAKTSLARNEADVAVRNRIKSTFGIDLPEGYGWGDWMDMLRNVIAKMDADPPVGKDGKKLDSQDIEHLKEIVDDLNHWVNQQTGRDIPPSQLPKTAKRLLRMSKNLTLGLLGPGMGTSVLFTELPFVLLRKNGSLRAFLAGLEELGNFNDLTEKDINTLMFAFEKIERGFQSKFGGEGVANDEVGYVKRLVKYAKMMFNPDPEQLSSSGIGRKMDYIDNFLANKAALSMEFGGMSQFVQKVLSVALEKEKVNLFEIKDKLPYWIKLFDNQTFKEFAQSANTGSADAQREVVRLFKAYAREAGIPLPIASYLWMSKISNMEEVSRLVRLIELGSDNQGSFDLRLIDKEIYKEGAGSVSNKVNKELNQTTLSKLAYYLELQTRNASPEPFGIGSSTFKYKRGSVGSILTFLASYPIAAYQTYILRNGTTHTAAAMLGISLGIMGMEIFSKRLKDTIQGKKKLGDTYEEYRTSPLAFFLRDLSYAQMGGTLDQALNPLYISMGKAAVNDGVKVKPQDFPIFAPEVGDLPAFTAINNILRQGYQAMNGLMKGDPSQLVDGLKNTALQGTVGKAPADMLKMLYNLSSQTKGQLWKQVYSEYGQVDTKNEELMHKLIKDSIIQRDILENSGFDPLKKFNQLPKVMDTPKFIQEPKVDIKSQVQSTTPIVRQSKATKSKKSQITPNMINALLNEKGVSPILVDELIKEMDK